MPYALSDMFGAFAKARLWGYISAKNIQLRYRRNVLGLLWLVIAFAIPSLGIGYVLARLQGLPLEEHVPHVLFGFVVWYFIIDCLVQGSTSLSRSRNIVLQAPIQRTVFPLSLVMEKMIILLVNLVTACALAAVFGWRPSLTMLFIPISLVVLAAAGLGSALFMSLVSVRLRDMTELVASVMRLAFFFTPIIWSVESRRFSADGFLTTVATYNPFTYFLEILRMPIQGAWPSPLVLIVTGVLTVLALIAAVAALQRTGRTAAFFV